MVRADVWRLVMVLVATGGAILAVGCGGVQDRDVAHVSTSSANVTFAPNATVTIPDDYVAAAPSESEHTEDVAWTEPSSEILSAFNALRTVVGQKPLFIPTTLPESTVVNNNGSAVDWVSAPAIGEVRVLTGDGFLQFLEVVEGDLGDLPGREVGRIQDEVAVAYRLMGGILVQWRCAGAWYGVYGKGLPEDVVIKIALGMKRI